MTKESKLTGYSSIDKPWLKYYSNEEVNAELPQTTLYQHIKNKNFDNCKRIAINYYGNNIKYESFFSQIDTAASALEALGVKENDIVTVCMINSPETIVLMFALNKIGATANMVYGVSTCDELKKYISDANSKIVFTLDMFQEKFLKIEKECKLEKIVVSNITRSMSLLNRIGAKYVKKLDFPPLPQNNKFISWETFIKKSNGNSRIANNPDAIAIITYTGGTTGGSKGVALSNKAVISVAEQYIIGEKELYRNSKWIQVLPLFIAYGVTCSLMIPLIVGMTLIVRIPMSDSIAELCKKFKPNHIMYGPAFWEAFAEDNKKLDLSNLIAPISGGDTLHENTENKINQYLERCKSPYKIMNGYGMTEVGAAISVNYKDKYEFGSVGLPFLHNIVSAFEPETENELKIGEIGEICICTPSAMSYYVNNKDETNRILQKHSDGRLWVHSGDLGYISENGFIHISGRLKRYMLYIKNGIQKKVFSLDIEKLLLKHPCVDKCAVVPRNDEVFNQIPIAYIILKEEYKNIEQCKENLQKFCIDTMEEFYRPSEYIFVKKFPYTKVGKVDYLKLEKDVSLYFKSEVKD